MKQSPAAARTDDAAALWRRFAISAVLILLLTGLIPAARASDGMAGGGTNAAPAATDPAE
ncbi:MAG TPA: hypothetical protein VF756_07325 [Thermoanaerobaculia bacterium]